MTEIVAVTEVEHYTDTLFRFKTEKPEDFNFVAGQFTMIGMGDDDLMRAYSITSAPEDDFLEFYSIKVPKGPLTSRLQHIKVGDTIEVGDRPTGTLVIDNLVKQKNLWMLGTGTGIAPFMSLIRDQSTFDEFKTVNVMWSVRYSEEITAPYKDMLEVFTDKFIPIVTRDKSWEGENRRITHIANFDPTKDCVMLCGSMDFNRDMSELLKASGFVEGNRKTPGTFVVEKAFVS